MPRKWALEFFRVIKQMLRLIYDFFLIKFHWEFLMCHHLLFKSKIKHYNIGSADFSNILMKLWYCYLKKKKKLEDILMLKYWKSGKIHWQIILHCNAVFPLKDKSNDKNNIQVELIEKGTERWLRLYQRFNITKAEPQIFPDVQICRGVD